MRSSLQKKAKELLESKKKRQKRIAATISLVLVLMLTVSLVLSTGGLALEGEDGTAQLESVEEVIEAESLEEVIEETAPAEEAVAVEETAAEEITEEEVITAEPEVSEVSGEDAVISEETTDASAGDDTANEETVAEESAEEESSENVEVIEEAGGSKAALASIASGESAEVSVTVNGPDGDYTAKIVVKTNWGGYSDATNGTFNIKVSGGTGTVTQTVENPSWIGSSETSLQISKDGGSYYSDGQTLDGAYAVSIAETSENNYTVSIKEIGTASYTRNDILAGLGTAINFSVFADYYYSGTDMEGNVAVNTIDNPNTIGNSSNVTSRANLTVEVKKTVTGFTGGEQTFKFGLFTSSGEKLQERSLTFTGNGTQSVYFDTIDSSGSGTGSATDYYVYELDEDGNKLDENEMCGSYTVSYLENGIETNAAIQSSNSANYVHTYDGKISVRSGSLYTTSTNIATDGGINSENVHTGISESDFNLGTTGNAYTTINDMLEGSLYTMSVGLASAKTSDDVSVVYMTAEELNTKTTTGAQRYLIPYDGDFSSDGRTVLINVICSGDSVSLANDSAPYYIGSTNVSGDKNWTLYAQRIIWNYVMDDGNGSYVPYTGTVSLGGGQAPGLELLPVGTIKAGNNTATCIIAKNVIQQGGEIHKVPFDTSTAAEVYVSNKAEEETGSLFITKNVTVNGHATTGTLADGTYTFNITKDDDASFSKQATITIENGAASTAPVSDLPVGTYTVTEDTTGLAERFISLASENGVKVTVSKDGNTQVDTNSASFTNDYSYTAEGSLVLEAKKTLTATAEGQVVEGKEFKFNLEQLDTAVSKEGTLIDSKIVTTGADGTGSVSFSEIKYTLEDAGKTYYYRVSEVGGGKTINGIVCDDTVYVIAVSVADKGDGTLDITKTFVGSDASEIAFTNTYVKNAEVNLGGNKNYTYLGTGNPVELKGGEFSFRAVETDAYGNELKDGFYDTARNNAEGAFAFKKITYTEEGTHYYTISEIIPADADKLPNVTYDESTYNVVVKVTEVDGELVAAVTGDEGGISFSNTLAGSLKITKTFTGTGASMLTEAQKNGITFEVTGPFNDGQENVTETVTYAQMTDGSYTFENIPVGTYTVTETNATVEGIELETTYEVGAESTTASSASINAAGGETTAVEITNTYTYTYKAEGSIVLEAEKTLAAAAEGQVIEGKTFTFTLEQLDTASSADGTIIQNATVTTDSEGKASIGFGEIKYTEEDAGKTYYYRISEVNGGSSANGINYDGNSYVVAVSIKDNGNGTLDITKKVVGSEDGKVAFTNTYVDKAEINLGGTKNYTYLGTDASVALTAESSASGPLRLMLKEMYLKAALQIQLQTRQMDPLHLRKSLTLKKAYIITQSAR